MSGDPSVMLVKALIADPFVAHDTKVLCCYLLVVRVVLSYVAVVDLVDQFGAFCVILP